MRGFQKFGKKMELPSTAQIIHELKMMASLDAVRAALASAPEAERREQIAELETLLAGQGIHVFPGPEEGVEMLRRGAREPETSRVGADHVAAT